MTWIDIVLGGLLAYGLIKGLWKGLFVELASLISLLAGIYIAVKFSQVIGESISDEPSRTASITAFIITFIIVVVAIILLAKVFTKLADFAGLGLLNKILGGLFGFLRMVLLLSVLLNLFLKVNSTNIFAEQKTLDDSLFFNPVLSVSNYIFPSLEEWFTEYKEETTAGEAN
jgi:membrane protein required for colicin V production